MFASKVWIFVWLFCIETLMLASGDSEVNLGNVSNRKHKLSGVIQWKYEKRPFCNAFTGCGKKRQPYQPYPLIKRSEIEEKNFVNEDMGEALSDLIDINAEPAVENVQKQIMSQAKIFEAIKEASKEIFRQKNKQKLRNQLQLQQQKLEEEENV